PPTDVAGAASGAAAGSSSVPLPVSPERTRIVTTSDADDEVRAAVEAVVAAAHEGISLERIAILHPTPRPYGRSLHEQLAAAGIPTNGTAVRPLAAGLVGRTALDLLALPDHDFRRSDVIGLLHRARLRTADGTPAPTAAWERLSREAGVVQGRAAWDQLLARLADGFATRADEAEAMGGDPHAETCNDSRRDHPEKQSRRARRSRDHRTLAPAYYLQVIT